MKLHLMKGRIEELCNICIFGFLRAIELTDDILHIIFSYLELKDRIRIERGIECN